MTLYNCENCRTWHSGVDHVCGPKQPEIRDQRTLEQAVVRAARGLIKGFYADGFVNAKVLSDLEGALTELDGLDRPFLENNNG